MANAGNIEDRLDAAAEKYLENKAEKYQKEKAESEKSESSEQSSTESTESEEQSSTEQSSATTEITVSDEKVTEITEKIKTENEGKSEEELKTLTDTALVTEKETLTTEAHKASSEQAIKDKIAEVKGREDNKEKSEEEILKLATEEIRSLKNNGDPPPATDPPGTEGQKSIDDQLSEKTEGKWKNIDELIAKAEEEPEEKIELSERLKKLYDLEKSGANVDKVLAFNQLGIDDLDPADFEQAKRLLKIEMKLEDSSMTESDLNYDISRKFDLDYTYAEDDEEREHPTNKDRVDNERRRMIREAGKAKTRLEETKEKYLLPDPSANSQAAAEATRQKLADLKEKWDGQVNTSLDGYDAISVKIEEGMDFRYLLDTDKLANLKEVISDPVAQFLGMYTKDGKTDIARMQQDIAILQNREDFISKLWEQAEESGEEKLIRRTSNLNTEVTPGGSNASTDVKHKTPAHQMVEGLKEELGI